MEENIYLSFQKYKKIKGKHKKPQKTLIGCSRELFCKHYYILFLLLVFAKCVSKKKKKKEHIWTFIESMWFKGGITKC